MMQHDPVPKEVLRVALPENVNQSLDLESLEEVAIDLGDDCSPLRPAPRPAPLRSAPSRCRTPG